MDHILSTIPCHESCNIHRGCSEYDLQNQYKPKLIIYKSNYLLCLPTRLKLEASILQAQDTINLHPIFKQLASKNMPDRKTRAGTRSREERESQKILNIHPIHPTNWVKIQHAGINNIIVNWNFDNYLESTGVMGLATAWVYLAIGFVQHTIRHSPLCCHNFCSYTKLT